MNKSEKILGVIIVANDDSTKFMQPREKTFNFDRLKDVVAQSEILDEVRQKYDLVSRYVTGHLHSDAFHAQPADCELLKKEIDAFDTLKGKIKSIKKQKTSSNN